ncbi:MAG: hypothetical protein JO356_08545 [Acidobacteria bacterium]|nr:hypothetical protein [Acidobacteriota bacterium]
MRFRNSSIPACWFRTSLPLIALIVFLRVASAQSGAPKYDPHTETKMRGVVEELKLPPRGSEKEIAHLVMKNGDQMIDVYLCPKSFIDEMGVTFTRGDEIAFTGSKVKAGEADMILAREVVKGQDTLVLRDDKGNPVWIWGH